MSEMKQKIREIELMNESNENLEKSVRLNELSLMDTTFIDSLLQIDIFSLQIEQLPLKFRVFNMFSLDFAVLFTVRLQTSKL